MTILILAGSTEASDLARQLAAIAPRPQALLSFAGRTRDLPRQALPTRVGGFGGVDGLRRFLAAQAVRAVIDATHPFARRMAFNAAEACVALNIPLLALTRPPWAQRPDDHWIHAADMNDAIDALGPAARRVFLTIGRQEIAAFGRARQHWYLARSIEPLGEALNGEWLQARGPFLARDEEELMRSRQIDIVVSKNSGGGATSAKLEAARALRLPVIMIARPDRPIVPTVATVDDAWRWLATHGLVP